MQDILNEMFGLQNKIALVTGGREGIGRAICLALASAGATVIIATRSPEKTTELVDECKSYGGEAKAVGLDVNNLENIEEIINAAIDEFGKIDILVNNAGISLRKSSLTISEQEWDEVQQTNLKGTFFVTQSVARYMLEQGSGKIINISSTFGVVGFPERAAYAASKAGIIQLTKVLALEWASSGITVNAIAPTTIETPSRQEMFTTEDARKKRTEKIPLGRLGTPRDLYGSIIFLASPSSDFITGHTLMVDGGWTAQ